MRALLHLEMRPHVERGGYHLDRFDAYLGDRVICTSRSGWHDPARRLLELAYAPETLLRVQHAARAFDPTIKPRPLGELAKSVYEESDKDGIKKRRWRPVEARRFPSRGGGTASAAGADAAGGMTSRRTPLGPLAAPVDTG